jgi:uncharacterized protein (UPF0332 family)
LVFIKDIILLLSKKYPRRKRSGATILMKLFSKKKTYIQKFLMERFKKRFN